MFGPIKKHARLVQWNGRRRSSRSDEPVLPRLWQRPVLVRLALVLLTTTLVTLLIYTSGPPLPYRLGEVYPNDLRVRIYFEVIDQAQTEWKREEAVRQFLDPEKPDPTSREEIRRAVPPVVQKFPPGMPLVQRGQPIQERQLALLQEEHKAYLRSLGPGDHWRRAAALFLVLSLLA